MNAPFHPQPRICPTPSGKIRQPSPAPPWTLPSASANNPAPTRKVACFACRQRTDVPATAVSARCSHCSAYIKLDDIILHSRTHRTRVQTCGSVTIQANADLKGLHIECRDLVLNGKASGDFVCNGVCKIKTDQHISGSLSARRLTVEKKATVLVTGGVHVENAWIQGTLEGTLIAEETITIHRNAKFLGGITARRLVIEEGGIHQGSFTRLS